jgi:hypothetical protein
MEMRGNTLWNEDMIVFLIYADRINSSINCFHTVLMVTILLHDPVCVMCSSKVYTECRMQ